MNRFELTIFAILFISHLVFVGISMFNYFTSPRIFNKNIKLKKNPFISILIPARNEESNIKNLLNSILSQSYGNYEIIVLDDNSSDATASIVEGFSKINKKIKLITGQMLPEGWLGKNWACYQLSQNAKGEYFLFMDADVTLNEHALSSALNMIYEKSTSMLSVFPTQKISSFGEWLIVPLMNWLLLNFLPLKSVYKSKNSKFVAANGQFILIRKDIYKKIGTHSAVRTEVVEDMKIAKLVKQSGHTVVTGLGGEGVYCKMYSSFTESYEGFAKNFYKGFNTTKPVFIFMMLILYIVHTAPILLIFINPLFLIIILLIVLERVFISLVSRQNWFVNLGLHPLQMTFMVLIGFRSALGNKIEWKGRSI